jgi:hypothetical protein
MQQRENLDRDGVLALYDCALEHNKILLLEVNYIDDGAISTSIAYGYTKYNHPSDCTHCRIKPLAGNCKSWTPTGTIGFGITHTKKCSKYWRIFQASKQDLLMYLDKPYDSGMVTKILDGTLKILEPKK